MTSVFKSRLGDAVSWPTTHWAAWACRLTMKVRCLCGTNRKNSLGLPFGLNLLACASLWEVACCVVSPPPLVAVRCKEGETEKKPVPRRVDGVDAARCRCSSRATQRVCRSAVR